MGLVKAVGVILTVLGVLLIVLGIGMTIFAFVYEPTMDGDHCSEFHMNESTGQVTQNGVDLDPGDDVHVYGRVTEMEENNPIPGTTSTHTYLALDHNVAVLIPNDIMEDGLENEDHLSVRGHIEAYLTVEYIEADSIVVEEGYMEEVCYAGCGSGVLGIILIIIGIILIAVGNKKKKQKPAATPPEYIDPYAQQSGYGQYPPQPPQQQQPQYQKFMYDENNRRY